MKSIFESHEFESVHDQAVVDLDKRCFSILVTGFTTDQEEIEIESLEDILTLEKAISEHRRIKQIYKTESCQPLEWRNGEFLEGGSFVDPEYVSDDANTLANAINVES